MNPIFCIEVNQPVGTFYLGKINSTDLMKIAEIKRLSENKGIQRDLNKNKIKNIINYSKSSSATFPTPIILAINSSDIEFEYKDSFCIIKCLENKTKADIIDGQHRLLGIASSNIELELPIVIMLDLAPEDKAFIFTTINKNQTKINKSHIYQLFELSNERSPIKVLHNITKILNESSDSPFYKKIKMLGKKINSSETLSQATFIDGLLKYFPSDVCKKTLFSDYYYNKQDEFILKIIINYFSAISEVFYDEWSNPNSIIIKTSGYGAFCKTLEDFYNKGSLVNDLTKEYFKTIFTKVREDFCSRNIQLRFDKYGSGEDAQNRLAKEIRAALSS